jgi:hypothetical protein
MNYTNNVWVYGCSFSEPFQLEVLGPVWDTEGNRILKANYWGTYLAQKLKMTCKTKSMSGIGLNYIKHQIDLDLVKWKKDDIIIINPSFFTRVNIMEFEDGNTREEIIPFFKEIDKIFEYNQIRWKKTINNLQHLGYNVYTWVVDDPTDVIGLKNIITAPDGNLNWKHWMDKHPEYWFSQPGEIYPLGDWHFNEKAHPVVADRMYEFIINNI